MSVELPSGTLGAWLPCAVDYPVGAHGMRRAAGLAQDNQSVGPWGLRPAAVMCRKMARFLVRLIPVRSVRRARE